MRRLVAILLFLSACATSPAPRETPREMVERFVGAFNRLSADERRALFASDATAFLPKPQHAARIDGRAAIIAALAPLFDEERKRLAGKELTLTAKDVAVHERGGWAVATFEVGTEGGARGERWCSKRAAGGGRSCICTRRTCGQGLVFRVSLADAKH